MGQLAGQDLIVLEKGLKTAFFKAFEAHPAQWPKIAMKTDSKSNQEKYGWLGSAPVMREWKDERVPKGLLQSDYTIVNNHYEASIGVNKDDFEDDQYGQIIVRIQDMAERAKEHPDELISTLRVAGTAALCYDGQYFYDTAHSEGSSGTLSNIVTGSGTSVSNIKTDFLSALAKFRTFKDDRGKPFHANNLQLVVVCPPNLEGQFMEFLTAAIISQTTNIFVNKADLMIDPYLSDTNDWYLDVVNRSVKGFIFQERKPVQFASTASKGTEFQSDQEFHANHVYYGIDARYNVGYGLWQNSVKVTNT